MPYINTQPQEYLDLLAPELILAGVACFLFLLGVSVKPAARKLAPFLALGALVAAFCVLCAGDRTPLTAADPTHTLHVFGFAVYVKLLAAAVGMVLVLLAWPTNAQGTGNTALNFGHESGEFFALMLLSVAGVFLVAGANDIILLFLGIELASIPTYIMVSISRPLPVAQEAGVKYFFLGAMSAAIMLFGFSYLYGTTGRIRLDEIAALLHPGGAAAAPTLTPWQMLAVVMLVAGFAFKIAAVPLHVYAGDVYQGAATPVTAFLSFVPKTSGFVALVKLLATVGGPNYILPTQISNLVWVLAALTMTVGNVLGLLQYNIKRLLAYSSIAHTGYMLVGVAALNVMGPDRQSEGLQGLLFYLASYGIMNAGAFGVLMLLPARGGSAEQKPGTSAETFEDVAGQGRGHVTLGLCMAVSCFSLIGLPLTIGFMGKFMLIRAALDGGLTSLVVITVVNAAISAAYYLKIVAAMFLRPLPPAPQESAPAAPAAVSAGAAAHPTPLRRLIHRIHAPVPLFAAIFLSVGGTLFFGAVLPATEMLTNWVRQSLNVESYNLPRAQASVPPEAS